MPAKTDIISQLRKDILALEGFRPSCYCDDRQILEPIRNAFPNSIFPVGALHEFLCNGPEAGAASSAFIAGILSSLMKNGGISVWISSAQNIFPPALKSFGVNPDKVIFIHLKKEKEKLWAMEEALKCDALASVVAEIDEISFTESRRFQIAIEQSKVTGFLIRKKPKNLSTACVTRWSILPLPGKDETDLPGIGFPSWEVRLLKVRNGKCRNWQMKWNSVDFELIQQPDFITNETKRKIV